MGFIPDEDVQRVREATDVVALISESVILKKKGRLFWGLCPFHNEKTPSFKVDSATQLWHCFGCGAGGDAFGFVIRRERMEFPDAVRLLADRAGIEIREEGGGVARGRRERLTEACDAAARFYHRTLVMSHDESAKRAREYLAGRDFGSEVAKRFMLGYAPGRGALVAYLREAGFTEEEMLDANLALRADRGLKDRFFERIMFPIYDIQGRAVAFGGRILGSGEPKYLNTSETPVFHKSRNLYAIDRAKNEIVKAGEAVVVEGYTDVIALHEAGVRNVVATLGTALTREHVKLLGRFAGRIVYLFDADEAGLRAADRAAEFIDVSVSHAEGGRLIDLAVAVVPESKDPADYASQAGEEGVRSVLTEAVPLLRFVLDRRLEGFDLSSPEDRAAALATVAPVLASVKSSILGQDYANYVADRLLVDYGTVQGAVTRAKPEFAGTAGTPGAEQSDRAAELRRRNPAHAAELAYVRLVVDEPSLREAAVETLASGLVADADLDRLLQFVVAAGAAVGTDLYDVVSASDAAAAETLSGVLLEDFETEDAPSVAREVLIKLKEFDLERQIIEKKARLRGLDEVKERVEYDELFRETAALQVMLDRVRRGAAEDADADESVG
ncbi:MAG: DNA primase [Coriobacteriia bacterium]|nr:DNA primase [Coriobacteriia bacterium]